MNGIVQKCSQFFKLNFRRAVIISVGLHFGILAAAAAILLDAPRLIGPAVDEINLELEVLAENEPIEPTFFDNFNQTESAGTEQSDRERGGTGSKDLGGDVLSKKQAALLASLNTLSALKESFNFVTHKITSDSTGAFVPIQGIAPDIEGLAAELNEAIQAGIRTGKIGIGGGGNCPGDG